jgi:glycosyltransferase involved in cell wall biosynthesis
MLTSKESVVNVIPSSLETEIFKPTALTPDFFLKFDVVPDKRYILFGAANATNDTRKGWDLLCECLKNSSEFESLKNVELLVFGNIDQPKIELSIPHHFLGEIDNDKDLVGLFNISTVAAVPSRADNLPFVAMESLACGTPVVAFDVGGLPDIIDDQRLGSLVPPFDTEDFAKKLVFWLRKNKLEGTVNACRQSKQLPFTY